MKLAINKRKLVLTCVLSILFSAMQVIGYQISMTYGTSVHQSELLQYIGILSTKNALLLALLEVFAWWGILYFLFTTLEKLKCNANSFTQRQLLLLWPLAAVLLFICWIPCFLAAYPGFYNYDSFNQVPQALYDEVPYSAHHPLLHTLIMGKLIALGYHLSGGVSLNAGIALHSIFQMLVCAAAFGYLIYYIMKITGRRIPALIAFCYYAFFPPIAMFAMSTTKDTLFSVLLQLFAVFLFEMLRDMPASLSRKSEVLRLIVTAVLMCLLRKNGIYIIVGLLPFMLLILKKYRKQCLILLGSALLGSLIISKGLTLALDAEPGSSEEALSVPIQQLTRVYFEYGEDAFEADELELIYNGISAEYLYNYNPFLSDLIKNYFDYNAVTEKPLDYLTLWIRKGIEYPGLYARAFLDNTYQAWYPGTSICTDAYVDYTYYFDMTMCAGSKRDSKIPELLEFYNQISTGYSYQKIPVIRLLFSIGAMFWVALFTLFYGIYRKNAPLTLAMLAVGIYCASALLGPATLVRYYLILFYGFPVSMGLLFTSPQAKACSKQAS